MVHVYNSSPGEAEAGESEVKGQPGLRNEIERKRDGRRGDRKGGRE